MHFTFFIVERGGGKTKVFVCRCVARVLRPRCADEFLHEKLYCAASFAGKALRILMHVLLYINGFLKVSSEVSVRLLFLFLDFYCGSLAFWGKYCPAGTNNAVLLIKIRL